MSGDTLPCSVLNRSYHGASDWMTEMLVEPEDLADLIRDDASVTLLSQTYAIRSGIRDNAIKPLRIFTQ